MTKIIVYMLFIVVLFGLGIWWQTYKFHDCRRVGHTKLYCIMDIGK